MQEVEEEYTVLTDPPCPPGMNYSGASGAALNGRSTLKVPVRQVRKVMRPVTVIKEVQDWAEVHVPASRLVEVDGYRIDEVEDTKVVEVEEVQEYELRPVPVGEPVVRSSQDVGRLENSRISRLRGSQIVAVDHPAVEEVEPDDQPEFGTAPSGLPSMYSNPYARGGPIAGNAAALARTGTSRGLTGPGAPLYGFTPSATSSSAENPYFGASRPASGFSASAMLRSGGGSFNGTSRPGSSSGWVAASASTFSAAPTSVAMPTLPRRSFYRSSSALATPTPNPFHGGINAHNTSGQYDRTGYADPKYAIPAGSYKKLTQANASGFGVINGLGAVAPELVPVAVIGLTIKNTHTRHTDGTGVHVTKVDFGSPSARAGLRENDLITSVQGQSVTTVDEFQYALQKIPGPLVFQLNRDGRRNLAVTVYR